LLASICWPRGKPGDRAARALVRRLYEATGGRFMRWRAVASVVSTPADVDALQAAVLRD